MNKQYLVFFIFIFQLKLSASQVKDGGYCDSLTRNKDYLGAIICFTELIDNAKSFSPKLVYYRALAYWGNVDYEKTKSECYLIINNLNKLHNDSNFVGKAYGLIGHIKRIKNDSTAVIDLKFALPFLDNSKEFEMTKTIYDDFFVALLSQKSYDTLVKYASSAIQTWPNDSRFYSHRSMAYVSIEKTKLALTDINQAIALDPTNYFHYFRRAMIYITLKRNYDACRDLEIANHPVEETGITLKAEIDKLRKTYCNK